jgi:hypothetical protein
MDVKAITINIHKVNSNQDLKVLFIKIEKIIIINTINIYYGF